MESSDNETFEAEVLQSGDTRPRRLLGRVVRPVPRRRARARADRRGARRASSSSSSSTSTRSRISPCATASMSIPTMILFRDGEPAAAVTGAQPEGRHRARARASSRSRRRLRHQLERRKAGAVGLLAARLRAEVPPGSAMLSKYAASSIAGLRLDEVADVPHELGVIDRDAPLGERVPLPVRASEGIELFVRRRARSRLQARTCRCRRGRRPPVSRVVRAPAAVRRRRVPDHPELALRVGRKILLHGEVREPESIEGDIDLHARAAVEDEVDAGEGVPVRLRSMKPAPSRAVVERLGGCSSPPSAARRRGCRSR